MKYLHVRHATALITYGGLRLLVDPIFGEKETSVAIPLTPNQRRNPMVGLSTDLKILLEADLVLSTHSHFDHFDKVAVEALDKGVPLICQPVDQSQFKKFGFTSLLPVETSIMYKSLKITRVIAQHGSGLVGKLMGHASGYILSADNEPTVYLAGDTIYTPMVKSTMEKYKPQVVVINGGAAQFNFGTPIVMNCQDIEQTMKVAPKLNYIVVHLDTFNHCIETRDVIKEYFNKDRLKVMGVGSFHIPQDNQVVAF